jgi:acyl-CoA synthetase (AMP-forming)/AMP-acid ligase II
MDPDGILYFVGRRDHMIKTLGYRVAPDEICNVLYASGMVAEAVVTSEPDRQRGERIIACVVLAPDATVDRLDHYCKLELPRYMHPARIDVREALPRLPNGKFDVRAIRDALRTAAASLEA